MKKVLIGLVFLVLFVVGSFAMYKYVWPYIMPISVEENEYSESVKEHNKVIEENKKKDNDNKDDVFDDSSLNYDDTIIVSGEDKASLVLANNQNKSNYNLISKNYCFIDSSYTYINLNNLNNGVSSVFCRNNFSSVPFYIILSNDGSIYRKADSFRKINLDKKIVNIYAQKDSDKYFGSDEEVILEASDGSLYYFTLG